MRQHVPSILCSSIAARQKAGAQNLDTKDQTQASVSAAVVCAHNWQEAYVAWGKNLFNPQPEDSIDGNTKPIVPNALQQQILDAVHQRCVYEATDTMENA